MSPVDDPVADLREAAKLLRKRVAAWPPSFPQTAEPWRVVLTDSESLTGVAACRRPAAEHGEHDACDDCWTVETYSEAWAAHIAPMDGLVALALADWFDAMQPYVQLPRWRYHTAAAKAVATARAYLGRQS